MTSFPDSAPEPPRRTALVAFLRGIEVRAWVFAAHQCSDEARAEQALARGFRDFLAQAQAQPLSTWPIQFWTSLLRQPSLMVAATPAPAPALAELPPGPRAALLLRLVAGLDLEHAAQALGVTQPAYEAALHRALAHPALDEAGLQALREQLLAQIQDAPAAQRQLLATWRDEAVLALDSPPGPEPLPARRHTPPRWMLFGGAAALALVVLFAVLHLRNLEPPPPVIDAVPPPPAISDTVAVTHPDYLQVAAGADAALAADLAFLSWFAAATLPSVLPTPAGEVAAPPAEFATLPADVRAVLVSARDAWAELDAPTRAMLLRQARDWLARPAAQREQLRAALRDWDALAAPERARRRTPFLAWQRLDDSDRRQLRTAAARLAGLPAAEQEALRAQFAASPPDTQALWWLGPALGQELAPFSSLFAFMPEADRPALLALLRELDAAARADLATLAPRLSEARRQALRRDLLAAPPERRAALVRERLAQ